MARVADQSERYDGMVQFLTDIIKSNGEDLNTEEKPIKRWLQELCFITEINLENSSLQ